MRRGGVVLTVLLWMGLLAVSGVRAEKTQGAAGGGLKAGDILGQSNWQKAQGLLPPEILKHYREGQYTNPIVDWPADMYTWPTGFLAGTNNNEGRYAVAEEGHIVDAKTGEQPAYLIGFPFPEVDPQDPAAGSKAVWNFLYRTWYFGNLRTQSQVNLTNADGLERRIDIDWYFVPRDGIPKEDLAPNPQNFIYQNLTAVVSPVDIHGTAALTWRYRDPLKRDSAWTYVSALRRVRQVSPANRSDGFLGSDMSQDDGPFFDGKPEDFVWKLTGEVDQLRIVDPINLQGKSKNEWIENGGGWRAIWPDIPFLGYMDPKWEGIAWAPATAALAKRRFYVVEGVPKDRYYLFGKLELYIDTITFQGAWNRKFNWKGELLNSFQVLAYLPHQITRPDGKVDFVRGSNMAFQCAESVKTNRATVAGIKSSPTSGFDQRVQLSAQLFQLDSLSRFGK